MRSSLRRDCRERKRYLEAFIEGRDILVAKIEGPVVERGRQVYTIFSQND